MTIQELEEVKGLISSPKNLVTKLQESSYDYLASWSDLEKQYDSSKHSIITDLLTYPQKLNENGQDIFKRTPLGLQKLSVSRLSQSLFSTPVRREYDYDRDSDSEKKAVDILENLYRVRNKIDKENIERGKSMHSSLQIATVWRAYDKPLKIKGELSNKSLTHQTYCEKDGYKLYPQIDEFGNLSVLSIEYTDTDDIEHFDVYVNGEQSMVIYLIKDGDWKLSESIQENPKTLEFFPAVYGHVDEPAWGGDTGTMIVEQLEEMESFDGLYIKQNAAPVFTLDEGEVDPADKTSNTSETSIDARRLIKVGKGGQMKDVSWTGAGESLGKRMGRLRNAFFEQIQIPDTSFANMIASNTSAENKELIFSDARQKAIDMGGEWTSLFDDEMEIVINFAKIMFPSYKEAFENISVRSIIMPYSVRNRNDNAEYVANAASSMSLETRISILGEASDIESEAEAIRNEQSASANQGF